MSHQHIPYPLTFPMSDLLVCEIENGLSYHDTSSINVNSSYRFTPNTIRPSTVTAWEPILFRPIRRVSRVAQYIYQKVVRRKPVPFQPSPEAHPNYILCYVEETLECGHKVQIALTENETLTARTRNCHECAGWFGGLKIKKPAESVKKVRPVRVRDTGKSHWWVVGFATACASLLILLVSRPTRHVYSYQHPQSYLRVIQNLDPCLPDGSCGYRYLMQLVIDGQAQEPTQMHFCKGLQPRFEQGHTLKYIVYANLGSCQAIERFDLVRENGIATLAANCKPDYSVAREFGHIACEGGKARF